MKKEITERGLDKDVKKEITERGLDKDVKKEITERGLDKDVKKEIFLKGLHVLRSVGRMTVNPETISWFSPDPPPHQQIASKHRQIGSSCFTAYPTQINVNITFATPGGVVLRRLASWDCKFESRRGHGILSLVECCVLSRRGL